MYRFNVVESLILARHELYVYDRTVRRNDVRTSESLFEQSKFHYVRVTQILIALRRSTFLRVLEMQTAKNRITLAMSRRTLSIESAFKHRQICVTPGWNVRRAGETVRPPFDCEWLVFHKISSLELKFRAGRVKRLSLFCDVPSPSLRHALSPV